MRNRVRLPKRMDQGCLLDILLLERVYERHNKVILLPWNVCFGCYPPPPPSHKGSLNSCKWWTQNWDLKVSVFSCAKMALIAWMAAPAPVSWPVQICRAPTASTNNSNHCLCNDSPQCISNPNRSYSWFLVQCDKSIGYKDHKFLRIDLLHT